MILLLSFCVLVHGSAFEKLNVSRVCDGDFCVPKVVWSHWDSDSVPDDIGEMIAITRKSLVRFTYCLLTPANISDFLDEKSFPRGYSKIHRAGKADYIRVCVLEKYGGIYIDSTTYVFSDKSMNWFISETVARKAQFSTFEYNWAHMEVEFSFIAASENSFFMKEFKREMDVALAVNHAQYSNSTCKRLRAEGFRVPSARCKPYFVIDLVYNCIIARNSTLNKSVLILPENRSNYALPVTFRHNKHKFTKQILDDPRTRNKYPVVKITSNQRKRFVEREKERMAREKEIMEREKERPKMEKEKKDAIKKKIRQENEDL